MTPLQRLLAKLPEAKPAGKGWSARCPAHDDRRASLSIAEGDDGRALVHCHAGCRPEAICAAIGLRVVDLMPTADMLPTPTKPSAPTRSKLNGPTPGKPEGNRGSRGDGKPRIVATYDYRDEAGQRLSQVVRFEPKDFRQRRPDGKGGWEWSVKGVRGVPYRLPELLADPTRPVLVVEGEKDADNLARLGLVATCNAGGAGKWLAEHAAFLRGRRVFVLPDNDDAGRNHAQQVAQSLQGIAASVRIVELPCLPEKGDASDWIDAQPEAREPAEIRAELERLAEAAPDWTPLEPKENCEASLANTNGPAPPEYRPFPVESLPSPAREFVESAASALACDLAYVALPLLTAMGAAVGNVRRVKLKNSWCEPCVFWTVVIGESGTLKSPALEVALEFLRRRQSLEYRAYADELREHEQWAQRYEADLAEWKRGGRKKGEPPPEKAEPPIWQQRLAEDTTVEALAVLLENQPRGMLVARDELSGWLNSFDAYKSARGADVAHWLSMHRAGSLLVNRKSGRNVIRVPRAAVSICGGVQPRTLSAALAGRYAGDDVERMDKPDSEHFANGLAARLLLAYPPRVAKRWTDADIEEGTRAPLAARFEELLSLDAPWDENGELTPVDLPLVQPARRRYIAFYNQNAKEQCRLSSDLAAAWSKVEGYAARFALLFELIGNPAASEVSDASMEAGITVAQWFAEEAARIYSILGGDSDSDAARQQREDGRLLEWIQSRGGRASVRDVSRGPQRFRGDAEAAEAALNRLVEAGHGCWDDQSTTEAGGRPTRYFVASLARDSDKTSPITMFSGVSSLSPVSPSENRVQVTI